MEYGKAFTFLTEDSEWVKKLAIAAGLMLASVFIPILPLLLLTGYVLELTRNVAHGQLLPLPNWDSFEEKLKHGAISLVIGFVYMLPLVLLIVCMAGAIMTTAIGASASTAAANGKDTGAAGGIAALIPIITACFGCLAAAYGIIAGLMINAATLIYLNSGVLGAAFRVREVWALTRQHLGDFVMIWVATLVANLAVVIVGMITCGLGYLAGVPWLMFGQAHLMGQVSRKVFPPSADALTSIAA